MAGTSQKLAATSQQTAGANQQMAATSHKTAGTSQKMHTPAFCGSQCRASNHRPTDIPLNSGPKSPGSGHYPLSIINYPLSTLPNLRYFCANEQSCKISDHVGPALCQWAQTSWPLSRGLYARRHLCALFEGPATGCAVCMRQRRARCRHYHTGHEGKYHPQGHCGQVPRHA